MIERKIFGRRYALGYGRVAPSPGEWLCFRLSGSIALANIFLSVTLVVCRIWVYFAWDERGGP